MRRTDPIGVTAVRGLVMGAVILAVLATLAGGGAARADAAIITYEGSFSRPDGKLRCTMAAGWAQCVSSRTGRVAGVNRDGSTESYLTTDRLPRGRRVTGHTIVNRKGTIACVTSTGTISCFALKWGSSFTQGARTALLQDVAGRDFIDDSHRGRRRS
jgi:hypothetical protein